MAFKKIEQIQIGTNPPGQAFGGYIYSFNATIGTSKSPTSITINVINDSGFYSVNQFSLSSILPLSIKVGDLLFSEMFLVSFDISSSVGSRTLTLNFKDSSIILDKIHVGLLQRDGDLRNIIPNPNTPFGILNLARNFKAGAQIPVHCSPCNTDEVGVGGSNKTLPLERDLYGGFITNADLRTGGIILIGTDEIVENKCKIPDVTYNFAELLFALRKIGFKILGFDKAQSAPGILARRNFTGSLRSVLDSWCNSFGYSYVWDFTTNFLVSIDLSVPTTSFKMDALRTQIESLKEGSDVSIQTFDESFSIENTVVKNYTSYFLRDARTLDFGKTWKERLSFRNLKISEIIPCEFFGPRNESELIVSATLAKYNKSARTLYNWQLLGKCTDLSPLGINLKYKFSRIEKERLINYNFNVTDAKGFEDKYGSDCDIFLGTYSEELENDWIDWELKVADFIGRYYTTDKLFDDYTVCANDYYLKWSQTTQPSSTKYQESNNENLPFKELLKHPTKINIDSKFPLWLTNRTPVFGLKDEDAKLIFFDKDKKDILQEFVPSFEPIDHTVRQHLGKLFEHLFPGALAKDLEQLKKEKVQPVIIFVPSRRKTQQVLVVGDLREGEKSLMINPLEWLAEAEREFGENKKTEKKCELACEGNLLDSFCCPDNDKEILEDGDVYVADVRARNFKVTTRLGSANFTLPSEFDLLGIINTQRAYRRTIPKVAQTFGAIDRPMNAMKFEIDNNNITSDLGEMLDQQGSFPIETVIVPIGTVDVNGTNIPLEIMRAEDLHNRTSVGYPLRITAPERTLSFKMAGMNYLPIFSFLNAQNGLESMSISVDENGTSTNFSFSTRPADLPEKDLLIDKISKSLRLNTFGRTF